MLQFTRSFWASRFLSIRRYMQGLDELVQHTLSLQASYVYVRCESDRKDAMKGEGEKTEAMVVRNIQRAAIAETMDEQELVAERVTALITSTGEEGKAFKVSDSVVNNIWIIESGAIAHMTFDSKLVGNIRSSNIYLD
ncbi:hypothetical protein COP2_014881 [Malus domestica]